MENIVILVVLPSVAFIIAWVASSRLAQNKYIKTQTELEITRVNLTSLQTEISDKEHKIKSISEEKAIQDIAFGRLEMERDNYKTQVDQLELNMNIQRKEIEALRKSEQEFREKSVKALESVEKLKEVIENNRTVFKERMEEKQNQVDQIENKNHTLEEEINELRKSEQQVRETSVKAMEAVDKLNDLLESTRTSYKERIGEKDQRIFELDQKLNAASESQERTAQQLAESREALKRALTQLEEKEETLSNYKAWWEKSKLDLKSIEVKYAELDNAHGKLKTSLDEKQDHFDEQLKLLQESKEVLKKEFEHLANEILDRKGKMFKELNQESITSLLSPIHNEMKGFRAKVEDIHVRETEQRVQLRTEMQNLQKLNKEITDQADKLTTALRGQKKVQGNWGELMLENVLDSSGLRPGTDYKREVSFSTDDGRQRPDVIVYLPQKQHLIIDAKTSLAAYTDYVNADNDFDRDQALAAHAKAVGARINELADKDYFRIPGLNSPEVVIMFIPIESAYVEALKYDEKLFQSAIERNVLVATPTTLLTSLNIVRQLWRFEDQNKHTAELASRAEKFYNKLNGFLTSMQGVGNQLDKTRETYDKAFGQLYSGRGNLIKQAAEFKELGVSVQKELPTQLVEMANLELGYNALEFENKNTALITNNPSE